MDTPCDRCGHPAREAWLHMRGAWLLTFCIHHSRQYQMELNRQGFWLMEARPC